MGTTTQEFDIREIVQKLEGEKLFTDGQYPVVYVWTGARRHRDSGPEAGIYEKP